jgi:putative transposase
MFRISPGTLRKERPGMRKSKFTEAEIIGAIKEHERRGKTSEISRKLGIVEHTCYRWKAKYGGMEVSDARRLRELEEENRKLKHIVAELTLGNRMLKDLNSKKW